MPQFWISHAHMLFKKADLTQVNLQEIASQTVLTSLEILENHNQLYNRVSD